MSSSRARTHQMIVRYRLHESVPVKLWPLEDIFPVRYDDIGDLLGLILPPTEGWPASPMNRSRIVINNQLSPNDARLVMAHEIGHAMCMHAGHLSSMSVGMESKHEREAWEMAAQLLIPNRVIMEEGEVSRIAAACNVPHWLVELCR